MIPGLIARGRSLWRGVRRRTDVEAAMAEEFRLHLELRAADLVRAGLSPAEARRQARLDVGCAELHKDAARASTPRSPAAGVRVRGRGARRAPARNLRTHGAVRSS